MIDIIGGGIGGLTTAIALQQKGIQVRVFEQATTIKPVGAGIILASNAMQVLDNLGLKDKIEDQGFSISSLNITTPDLIPMSKIDLTVFEKEYQVKNRTIHRGVLQQILVGELKEGSLYLNHQLKDIKKTDTGYRLYFENGKHYDTQTIIGADGLNSKVRDYVFPKQKIRQAKQVCWRGISNYHLPASKINELNEAWGKEERFGFVQIEVNKVYWYALKRIKNSIDDFSLDQLENYFKGYDDLIIDLIKSTNKNQIHTAEMEDLKLMNIWYKDHICLLGDAVHATTPNLGQGACQAIESAYVLANTLVKYPVQEAFQKYQKLRLPKAHFIVKSSWRIGKMAHMNSSVLVRFRNMMMRLAPEKLNIKSLSKTFKLNEI